MIFLNKFKNVFSISLFFVFFISQNCLAFLPDETAQGYQDTYRGEVINLNSQKKEKIEGTNREHILQNIKVQILNKDKKGQIVDFDNDRIIFEVGDKFYFDYYKYEDGSDYYAILHRDRMSSVLFLIGVFIFVVIAFGGWQGVRSLISLAGSLFVVLYLLAPSLLGGVNPLFVSFLMACGILFMAIFFTHGFNRESAVAYFGTMISIFITGLFALFAVYITKLSGLETEESVLLSLQSASSLNFVSLLLGSIIIGVLGVLDDISVTQAAFVTELYNANKNIKSKEVYKRAARIGREHVGALVNTLALAYSGAFLPVILYFQISPVSQVPILNLEVFATEIIRIIVSSVGLVLTVPIVTLMAVKYLKNYTPKETRKIHHH